MKGKVIVITGATGCVGAAASRQLAADGHTVVVVGRSVDKTSALARELGSEHFIADFARLRDVHALADRLLANYPRIDVLANNAGGVFGPARSVTVDGHETTFQVNYLAGFLLTMRLMERLVASRATVVCTSGLGNGFGGLDIDDLENERNFSATKAYCRSKLAQILFVRELYRRYGRGRGIGAAAFHPGNVASPFCGESNSPWRWLHHPPIGHPWAVTPEEGADTLVFLAEGRAEVDFPSGQFFARRTVATANPQAYDRMLGFELWNRSETMIAPGSAPRDAQRRA